MWAAFKSDLKEFASGAANETNAVASKVVGGGILKEGSRGAAAAAAAAADLVDAAAGDDGSSKNERHDNGSVLLANAAYSIGTKSLQGLSSVTSLVGGIVAPRASSSNYNHDEYNNNNHNRGGTSYGGGSALSSMLVKDDEEEMGWDDDDDDELYVEEDGDEDDDDHDASVVIEGKKDTTKQANAHEPMDLSEAASDSNIINAPPPPPSQHSDKSSSPSVDEEVLRALQTKLELVEKCRVELQNEHRRQTAELVELRAKLVEMEQQQHHQSSSSEGESVLLMDENTGTNQDSVQALQHEIERLKQLFEEQLKDASEEHKQAVAVLIQEKESLEKELHAQRQKNQDLVTEMQTLMDTNNQRESQVPAEPSIEEQALLHQYQTRIQELTLELEALQANLDDTTTALNQVNDHNTVRSQRHQEEMEQQLARTSALEETLIETKEDHARAIEEVEESKVKLVEMEKVVQDVRTELETKELEFENRLQVEIARVKTSQSESILNTTTASSYVTSDDSPRHDEEEDEEDIINDHVNLAAAVTNRADVGDNIIAKGSYDEESRKVDAKIEQTPAGVVDLAKSDTEEELSDDWGDGGWGDDD